VLQDNTKAQYKSAQRQDVHAIPVLDCGPDFPMATLLAYEDRAHHLLDLATHRVPAAALRQLDKVSKAWLEKWQNAHLSEIEAIAERLNRPGATFFSVNYEWGCTCRVAPSPDNQSARLVRVLDWKTPGLYHADLAGLHRRPDGDGTRPFLRGSQSGPDAQKRRFLLPRLGRQPAARLEHAAHDAVARFAQGDGAGHDLR
jgi:hypothetical protein